ncbi:hypothetical protein OA336_02725 [Flavobacteriaceae bacterium]|nr:hypothetical protein [Flavobacteriaceae bacterium]
MRNKIIQYLLIFISLIALYLFISDLNKSEAFAASQERMTNRMEKLKDSIAQLVTDQTEHAYFSFALNHDAQQAYPNFSTEDLQLLLEVYLLEQNDMTNGNPLLTSIGKGWIVNKISVVNHKWLLADFTNGSQWGDALFQYQVNINKQVRLRLLNHVMYP